MAASLASPMSTPRTSTRNSQQPRPSLRILRLVQQNAHRSSFVLEQLLLKHQNDLPDIICVQEPPFVYNLVAELPQYTAYCSTDATAALPPRAAVYVHYRLRSVTCLLQEHSSRDLAVIRLQLTDSSGPFQLVLSSLYIAPRDPRRLTPEATVPDHIYAALTSLATTANSHLLCCDTNSHCTAWGGDVTDARGYDILDLLLALGLVVLNDDLTWPTFEHGGGRIKSFIDISACTSSLLPLVSHWQVWEDFLPRADHRTISFNISAGAANMTTERTFYNYRRADQLLVRSHVRQHTRTFNFHHLATRADIDAGLAHITAALHLGLSAVPRRKPRRVLFPFWTQELHRAKLSVRHLMREYCRAGRAHCINNSTSRVGGGCSCSQCRQWCATRHAYHSALHAYHQHIRDAENAAFVRTATRLSTSAPYDLLRKLKNHSRPPTQQTSHLRVNGAWIADDKAKSEVFADHFFGTQHSSHEAVLLGTFEPEQDFPPITVAEIRTVVKAQPSMRAPGSDGIQALLLRWCLDEIQTPLRIIFNACLHLAYFPSCLKQARVIILPKPNRDDYSAVKNCRPISLLPVLARVFERLLYRRLLHHAHTSSLSWFHNHQFGFLPQLSPIDAVEYETFLYYVYRAADYVILVLKLDISGAFDSILHSNGIDNLIRKGAPDYLVALMRSYFSARKNIVTLNCSEATRTTIKGAPQGGCLSPLLWILVHEQILSLSLPEGCEMHAFAHDSTLIVRATTLQAAQDLAHDAFDIIATRASTLGLTINGSKTELLRICRVMEPPTAVVNCAGALVTATSPVRSLGVYLDNRLHVTDHFQLACARALRLTFAIRRVANQYWGPTQDFFVSMYLQVIIPTLLYGVEIWFPVLQRVSTESELQRFERTILLMCTGCLRTTALNSLRFLAGVEPLKHYAELACARRGLRLAAAGNALVTTTLDKVRSKFKRSTLPPYRLPAVILRNRLLIGHGIALPRCLHIPAPCDWPPPWRHLTNSTITIQDHDEALQTKAAIASRATADGNVIRIYTDASTVPAGTAIATFTMGLGKQNQVIQNNMERRCINFQGELPAVALAVHALVNRLKISRQSINEVHIFTDSQATLPALACERPQWPQAVAVNRLLSTLQALRPHTILHFRWVPRHVGIAGNEHADRKAKAAHQFPISTYYGYYAVLPPSSTFLSAIRSQLRQRWHDIWQHSLTGRELYKLFPKPPDKNDRPTFNTRWDQVLWNRMCSDHLLTNVYSRRFQLASSSACECGHPSETRSHLLFFCPNYATFRTEYHRIYSPLQGHLPWRQCVTTFLTIFQVEALAILRSRFPQVSGAATRNCHAAYSSPRHATDFVRRSALPPPVAMPLAVRRADQVSLSLPSAVT